VGRRRDPRPRLHRQRRRPDDAKARAARPRVLELLKLAACIGNTIDVSSLSVVQDGRADTDALLQIAVAEGMVPARRKANLSISTRSRPAGRVRAHSRGAGAPTRTCASAAVVREPAGRRRGRLDLRHREPPEPRRAPHDGRGRARRSRDAQPRGRTQGQGLDGVRRRDPLLRSRPRAPAARGVDPRNIRSPTGCTSSTPTVCTCSGSSTTPKASSTRSSRTPTSRSIAPPCSASRSTSSRRRRSSTRPSTRPWRGLAELGVELHAHPTNEEMARTAARVWKSLEGHTMDELLELPRLTDPHMRAALGILAVLFGPSHSVDPNSALRHVREHGRDQPAPRQHGRVGDRLRVLRNGAGPEVRTLPRGLRVRQARLRPGRKARLPRLQVQSSP